MAGRHDGNSTKLLAALAGAALVVLHGDNLSPRDVHSGAALRCAFGPQSEVKLP